jgi:sugar O-acyltransferase (sialic acid O-acetyltransferase NeuD family)
MAKVILFGVQELSEMAHYYLSNDSEHEVVAFTVNQEYIKETNFRGLPVVPYENIVNVYPPDDFKMFIPMSARKMNTLREKVYLRAKLLGYELISYVNSKASVTNSEIGDNCFILENTTIHPYSRIGNNIVLFSTIHIGHHSIIHDHVSIHSHVVIAGHTEVGSYSNFGVGSLVRNNLKLAKGTYAGMGSCIIHDTEAWRVYVGNPAKMVEGKTSMDIS